MEKEVLEKLTLHELCELLVDNSVLLLNLIEEKADGTTLRDLRNEVELLQEVVRTKRAEMISG